MLTIEVNKKHPTKSFKALHSIIESRMEELNKQSEDAGRAMFYKLKSEIDQLIEFDRHLKKKVRTQVYRGVSNEYYLGVQHGAEGSQNLVIKIVKKVTI